MAFKKFNGKNHQVKVQTPEGEAMWCSLKSPATYPGDDKSNYKLEQFLSKEEAQPLRDQADSLLAGLTSDNPKARLAPFSPFQDLDDGRVLVKMKTPHFEANDKYAATEPIPVHLWNEETEEYDEVDWSKTDWEVGNGSIIKVGGYLRPYQHPQGLGVSFRISVVVVNKLEKYRAGASTSEFNDMITTGNKDTSKKKDPLASGEVGQPSADF